MNRDELIAIFLARNGFEPSFVEPLAQDASFRRYLRIRTTQPGRRSAVLMDAPPPEDVRPFLRIAAHLRAIGVRVPAILAANETSGLVLEEDLGDDLLSVLLDHNEAPDALMDAAIDSLVLMQRAPPPEGLPLWDAATMVPPPWARCSTGGGRQNTGNRRRRRRNMRSPQPWQPCLSRLPAAPVASSIATTSPATCSGCRTIMSVSSIFRAPPLVIPLMTLCPCCRTPAATSPKSQGNAPWTSTCSARPEMDTPAFHAAFAACAAQRHLRVACQWVRLALRDARPQYLAHGPRTWRLLGETLSHPATEPLARALDRWIPAADRGNPSDLSLPT